MDAFRCFNLQERLMPFLRAETARRLVAGGMRQARIAEQLGVSQAMVSKYLRQTLVPPPGVAAQAIQAMVDRAVESATASEAAGRLPAWCVLCPSSAQDPSSLQECLRGDTVPERASSQRALEDLEDAAERIRRAGFGPLAPEVSINIARALSDARDSRGVAAFPGRFVETKGEVRPVAPPEFGASQHLSQLLLRLRRLRPDASAVLCLRYDEAVRAAMKAAGLRTATLRRVRGELQFPPLPKDADAYVDVGAFGIEPITYVVAATATDAVAKAERILKKRETKK